MRLLGSVPAPPSGSDPIGSLRQPGRRRPGNGSSSAAPKMTTMTAISTRFATEMVP